MCATIPGPAAAARVACRHCLCRRAAPQPHRRGLCQRCYLCPAVRRLYPSPTSVAARGGDGHGDRPAGVPRPPPRPTDAPPGSLRKRMAMELRAALAQQLFHHADAKADADDAAADLSLLGWVAARHLDERDPAPRRAALATDPWGAA